MRVEVSIRENGSRRVQMYCDQPSLTRQEFKDECDLGKIIRRFCKTREGQQALANAQGFIEGTRFEDVSSVPDFQTARNIINRGNAIFEALPAALRARFGNDAARFLDFTHDSRNLDELRKMGFAKPLKAVDPVSSTPPPKA